MINDVSAGQLDPNMFSTVAELGISYVIMHMQGTPESMQQDPNYSDVVDEVTAYLVARADACLQHGIPKERILLDPGFGFGKTTTHNLLLLQHLEQLVASGYPVLAGLSRKSMIGQVLGLPVDKRLYPGVALAVLAVWKGAAMVRCHDVRETLEAIRMCEAVRDVI